MFDWPARMKTLIGFGVSAASARAGRARARAARKPWCMVAPDARTRWPVLRFRLRSRGADRGVEVGRIDGPASEMSAPEPAREQARVLSVKIEDGLSHRTVR